MHGRGRPLAQGFERGYLCWIRMTGFDVAFALIGLAYIAGCAWLTARVWRSSAYERSQKVLQSKLIWLLPIIGAVLVFSLMPEDDDAGRPRPELKR